MILTTKFSEYINRVMMKSLIKGVLLVILALPQVSLDCLSQDKETVSMNLDRLKERLGVRFVYDSELGKLLDKNY